MSLSDWLITLTIIITIVPLLKMAKEKQFGFYNISIVLLGVTILIVSIAKNRKEESKEKRNETVNATNEANIKKLVIETGQSRRYLSTIKASLDTIGLAVSPFNGKVSIEDIQKIKKFILSDNSTINVTSINQKGGQTANEITNN